MKRARVFNATKRPNHHTHTHTHTNPPFPPERIGPLPRRSGDLVGQGGLVLRFQVRVELLAESLLLVVVVVGGWGRKGVGMGYVNQTCIRRHTALNTNPATDK